MLYNKYNFTIAKFGGNENRPELDGVFITPSETVATDGFRMIRVKSIKKDLGDYPQLPAGKAPKTNFQPFILNKKTALKIASELAKIKEATLPILENAVITRAKKDSVEITFTDLETIQSIMARPVEGKYPNYKEIINKREGRKIVLDTKLLKDIIDFFNDFTTHKQIELYIPKDSEKPIYFTGTRVIDDDIEQRADAILALIKEG